MRKAYVYELGPGGCACTLSEAPMLGANLIVDDPATLPSEAPEFWTIVDGVIQVDTAGATAQEQAENSINQTKAAYAREKELGFDENYKTLVQSIIAGAKLAGTTIPPKTSTADAEWQVIWTERDSRVSANNLDLDYSAVGAERTHSYSELKAEMEAL